MYYVLKAVKCGFIYTFNVLTWVLSEMLARRHIGIEENQTIKHGHEIAHDIENMLMSEFEGVSEVIIHLEPVTKDKED